MRFAAHLLLIFVFCVAQLACCVCAETYVFPAAKSVQWSDPDEQVIFEAWDFVPHEFNITDGNKVQRDSCKILFVQWRLWGSVVDDGGGVQIHGTSLELVAHPKQCTYPGTCHFRCLLSLECLRTNISAVVGPFVLRTRAIPLVQLVATKIIVDPSEEVTLVCLVASGTSEHGVKQSFEWFVDQVQVLHSEPNFVIAPQNDTAISCKASQSPGNLAAASKTLNVFVRAPPIPVLQMPVDLLVSFGKTAKFHCIANPGAHSTEVLIQWLQMTPTTSNMTETSLVDNNQFTGTNTPELTVSSVNQTIWVSCLFSQPNSTLTSRSRIASVLPVDPPAIVVHPKPLVVKRGKSASMGCSAQPGQNGQRISSYYWFKNGNPLFPGQLVTRFGERTQTLQWTDVHSGDEGVYNCVAVQSRGAQNVSSNAATLEIADEAATNVAIFVACGCGMFVLVSMVICLDQRHRIQAPLGLVVRRKFKHSRLKSTVNSKPVHAIDSDFSDT